MLVLFLMLNFYFIKKWITTTSAKIFMLLCILFFFVTMSSTIMSLIHMLLNVGFSMCIANNDYDLCYYLFSANFIHCFKNYNKNKGKSPSEYVKNELTITEFKHNYNKHSKSLQIFVEHPGYKSQNILYGGSLATIFYLTIITSPLTGQFVGVFTDAPFVDLSLFAKLVVMDSKDVRLHDTKGLSNIRNLNLDQMLAFYADIKLKFNLEDKLVLSKTRFGPYLAKGIPFYFLGCSANVSTFSRKLVSLVKH
jgi:hypothetical protein